MYTKCRYFIRISIIFLFLLLLLPVYRAEAASVKIKLNKTSVIMYTEMEETVKLSATVTGSSKKIKWSSSNKKVAVVNAFGKVTAKKVGTAVITAKIGKAVAKCNVTVEKGSINVPEAKITVNSYNSLLLKWEKVSGASGYAIWRKTAGTPFKQITVLSSAGKCSYVDKKLSTGTKYFYVIKAYKKFENKTIWSAASKRITAVPKMTKPIIRFVKVNGSQKLTVTWDKVPGASGYFVYRAASKNGPYKKIKTLAGKGKISYTDTGLSAGKRYYYKIKAYRTEKKKNFYSDKSNAKSGKSASCKVTVNLPKEREALLYEIIEKGCREKIGLHFDASLNTVKKNDYIDISALGYSNESAEDKTLVNETYKKVFYDHPEFFYLDEGIYRYGPQGKLKGIIPVYHDFAKNAENLDVYECEMEASITQALKCVENITDPVEQLLALYDYIAEHTLYNWEAATNNIKNAPDYAWTAYGQLVKHDAVCKGVAMSYKLLIDRLNNPRIKCIVVGSKEMDHVWNIVTIDGKDSYHIDVNKSINNVPTLRGKAAHSCFLLSDEKVKEKNYRGWVETSSYETVPSCNSKKYESDYIFNDLNFPVYRKNGVYYYLKQNGFKTYLLCSGGLTGAGTILAEIPILKRELSGKNFRINSGVVWNDDVLYYVNTNLQLTGYHFLTGESRILGNIAFTYQPSPDGYYGEEYDGIGLYFDESTKEVVAVSRTRRNILGRFKVSLSR